MATGRAKARSTSDNETFRSHEAEKVQAITPDSIYAYDSDESPVGISILRAVLREGIKEKIKGVR